MLLVWRRNIFIVVVVVFVVVVVVVVVIIAVVVVVHYHKVTLHILVCTLQFVFLDIVILLDITPIPRHILPL